jgi:hypothetical protein
MTDNKKNFDCLEFKRQAQEQILKEREGLSPAEQIKKTEDEVLKDPDFGPLWQKLISKKRRDDIPA